MRQSNVYLQLDMRRTNILLFEQLWLGINLAPAAGARDSTS